MASLDPEVRFLAAYQVSMAARYLGLHRTTLSTWLRDSSLVHSPGPSQMSFMSLVEAHVLSSFRQQYRLSMQKIRQAVDELQDRWPEAGEYPLATELFLTDGKFLFIEKLGGLFNLNQGSQAQIRKVLEIYLERIDHDGIGPIRLFPFTVSPARNKRRALKKPIVINPYISFGRPVSTQAGIATEVLYDRFLAGETARELAEDYDISPPHVEEIVRYEGNINRAA